MNKKLQYERRRSTRGLGNSSRGRIASSASARVGGRCRFRVRSYKTLLEVVLDFQNILKTRVSGRAHSLHVGHRRRLGPGGGRRHQEARAATVVRNTHGLDAVCGAARILGLLGAALPFGTSSVVLTRILGSGGGKTRVSETSSKSNTSETTKF